MIHIKTKNNGMICKIQDRAADVMNEISNMVRGIIQQKDEEDSTHMAFAVMLGLAVSVPKTKALELLHDAYEGERILNEIKKSVEPLKDLVDAIGRK